MASPWLTCSATSLWMTRVASEVVSDREQVIISCVTHVQKQNKKQCNSFEEIL